LFVAPCSHTWHFKCIRSLLEGTHSFLCPNCRAHANLEADVEEPDEEWKQMSDLEDTSDNNRNDNDDGSDNDNGSDKGKALAIAPTYNVPSTVALVDGSNSPHQPEPADTPLPRPHPTTDDPACSRTAPVPTASTMAPPAASPTAAVGHERPVQRTPSPTRSPGTHGPDGPITPRNDVGPWVFDGAAGHRPAMPGQRLPARMSPVLNSGSIDDVMDLDDER